MSKAEEDENLWQVWDDSPPEVVPFPGERVRRFVALQRLGPDTWRAAVFVGWFIDRRFKPSSASYLDQARALAELTSDRLGLPLISDRFSVPGRGVGRFAR